MEGPANSKTGPESPAGDPPDFEAVQLALDKAEELAGIGSFYWDLRTDALLWSRNMYRLAGLDRATFAGNLSAAMDHSIHPDDVERVRGEIAAMLAEKRAWPMEFRMVRPDGAVRVWRSEAEFILGPDGEVERCVGLHFDVTERRRTEAELAASEARFRAVFEQTTVGLSLMDLSGRIVEANPALQAMQGYSAAELVALDLSQVAHRDYLEQDRALIVELIRGERGPYTLERPILHKDGRQIWTRISVSLVRDAQGEPAFVLSLIEDITARRQAELALRDYSDQLETLVAARTAELEAAQERLRRQERLALLGQLAGSLGHELRNPLNVITNAVYLLQMSMPEPDTTQGEVLDIIANEVRKADKMIHDLLDFGRVQASQRDLIPVALLLEMAQENCQLFNTVELEVAPADHLPLLRVDSEQILQVLCNLILNAVQAMPGGGRIWLSAAERDDGVALTVRDNGPGIAPEHLDKVFEPLFTTKARGMGLGLAICQKLVEANGGQIALASTPGQGATFEILLPAAGRPESG